MYKKGLLWFILGSCLLSMTSCYKEVLDLEYEPFRPVVIGNAIRDSLSMERLLKRESEKTQFEYESDGTCVAVYRETVKMPIPGMNTEVKSFPTALSTTLDLSSTPTSTTFNIAWHLLPGKDLTKVYFDPKKTKKFGLLISYKHTTSGASSTELTGNIKFNGPSKVFKVKYGEEIFLDLKEYIAGENDAVPLKHGNTYNLIQYVLDGVTLSGITIDGKVQVYVTVAAENLYLRKAFGKSSGTPVQAIAKFKKNIDIFGNLLRGEAVLPKSVVRLKVKKDINSPVDLFAQNVRIEPSDKREDGAPIIPINNKPDTDIPEAKKASTFWISTSATPKPNSLTAEETERMLILDKENSNIDDAFGKTLYELNIDLSAQFKTAGGGSDEEEIPLSSASVDVEVETRIPFVGSLVTSKMVSEMEIAKESFPAEYNQYIQNEKNTGDVKDAIKLHIALYNTLPMDAYGRIEFLDQDKNTIMRINMSGDPTNVIDTEFPLFIRSAEVGTDGRSINPTFLEHTHAMSVKEYENLSKNAKFFRTTYYFITPGAAEKKIVRVLKDNYLLLQVAAEVKGCVTPKDIKDIANKN